MKIFERKQKGSFVKEAVLADVPSFRQGPAISSSVAFFYKGSIAEKDLEEMSVQGNICQNHPFGNHPVAKPRNFRICEPH